VASLLALPVKRFVLDGEIIIREESFETLQLRLHPAATRIEQLAHAHPATFVAFDLLADAHGLSLLDKPFAERRSALEAFFKLTGKGRAIIRSRGTRSRAQALKWIRGVGNGLDGIMCKLLAEPYCPGERAMLKYKVWRTVDCVVGGYYPRRGSRQIEYLLLGLYDRDGRLNYVGRAGLGEGSAKLARMLSPLVGGLGFTGRAPGEKSRWSNKSRKVVPLRPKLVVEASADHIENGTFCHGARLLRWRDDKKPEACTLDQLA
jgi:ATP-dependent DNA ligase